MTPPAEPAPDIAHAAAEWVIRRDRGLSPLEKADFEAWHSADPKHREEFARIASGWNSLDRLAPAPVLSAAADAVLLRVQARQSHRRVIVMAGGLLAAAACLALGAFLWLRPVAPSTGNYQVIASTSREIHLPDGSLATLNGDSRIETDYTTAERRIRLVRGEALFTVAKNPDRPFFVTAGPITVRAVGTAFNVRLGASAVEVLVTEGKVRVDDHEGRSLLADDVGSPLVGGPAWGGTPTSGDPAGVLSAGHRVVVNLAAVVDASTQARIAAVAPAEMEQSLAWQSTRLVFNDTPLDEVVVAFNRYNPRRQLTLGDRELASRRITGMFRADNLDGFVRLLEVGVDVKAETNGDHETVLRAAR